MQTKGNERGFANMSQKSIHNNNNKTYSTPPRSTNKNIKHRNNHHHHHREEEEEDANKSLSPLQMWMKNLLSIATACGDAPVGISQQVAFVQENISNDVSLSYNQSVLCNQDDSHNENCNDNQRIMSNEMMMKELPIYMSGEIDWNKVFHTHNNNHDDELLHSNQCSDLSYESKVIEIVMPKLDSKMQMGEVQWVANTNSDKKVKSKASDVLCIVSNSNKSCSMALDLRSVCNLDCMNGNQKSTKTNYYLAVPLAPNGTAKVDQVLGIVTSNESFSWKIMNHFKKLAREKIERREIAKQEVLKKKQEEKKAEMRARKDIDDVIEESTRLLREEELKENKHKEKEFVKEKENLKIEELSLNDFTTTTNTEDLTLMSSQNFENDSQLDLSSGNNETIEEKLMKFKVLREGATKEYTRLVTYHDHKVSSSFCRGTYCNKQVLLINTGTNDLFCVVCGGVGNGKDGAYEFSMTSTQNTVSCSISNSASSSNDKTSLAGEVGKRAIVGWKMVRHAKNSCTICGKDDAIMMHDTINQKLCVRCNGPLE